MGFNRSVRTVTASLALLAAGAAWSVVVPGEAHAAVTAKECHAKFKAAKEGGTLAGQSYKEFKAAQCAGAEVEPEEKSETPAAASIAAPAAATPAAASAVDTKSESKDKTASKASTYSGNAVFPSQVSSKYSSLSAGKARMKTCLDQYHANKASGGNGGLNWIQKGGGYYSVCTKRLKGE
ncbi:hypothetical protein [Acetobacter sp.]|jgi:hypothetical protein|uniref:hypothetical protein n=1 Tax=Acetobacter sp. TaxID=440 RepID=UPI0025C23BED|nr:hypothetical protein [Acetobacter sp.]MCH4091032.1 hypothetical protein [Acetobacter sp.]MCI1300215.1 hypothetical protein [Acetobacter sp.]MCI1316117.1 hypothetical protein [Acetobacter sp.]